MEANRRARAKGLTRGGANMRKSLDCRFGIHGVYLQRFMERWHTPFTLTACRLERREQYHKQKPRSQKILMQQVSGKSPILALESAKLGPAPGKLCYIAAK